MRLMQRAATCFHPPVDARGLVPLWLGTSDGTSTLPSGPLRPCIAAPDPSPLVSPGRAGATRPTPPARTGPAGPKGRSDPKLRRPPSGAAE
jgi:hypothetical protein